MNLSKQGFAGSKTSTLVCCISQGFALSRVAVWRELKARGGILSRQKNAEEITPNSTVSRSPVWIADHLWEAYTWSHQTA
jgi:hypothetical protein